MSDIKELSPHIKILEIFSLQFFSLSNLNLKSKTPKFASKKFTIFFFLCSFLFVSFLTCVRLKTFDKNKFKHENLLGLGFRILVITLAITRTIAGIFESYYKVRSNQYFFVILNEFCEFFEVKFKMKISFEDVKKNLGWKRLLAILSGIFLVAIDFYADFQASKHKKNSEFQLQILYFFKY